MRLRRGDAGLFEASFQIFLRALLAMETHLIAERNLPPPHQGHGGQPVALRKHALGNERLTMFHVFGQIDSQHGDGGAAGGRPSAQVSSGPAKVRLPFFFARMKQWDGDAGARVDAGEVRSFAQIATGTGQTKVRLRVVAKVLFRPDVFDVKGNEGLVLLSQPAVFAAESRPCGDTPPPGGWDHALTPAN